MFASISLTVYNRKKLSSFCIKTVHNCTPREEYEFIVVDNGSTDGAARMLRKYRRVGVIDRLVTDHFNNLGLAINDAWKIASPKAGWLIVLDNDNFAMKGWFDNFKLVANSELRPDYIFCDLRMPGFVKMDSRRTKNGGNVLAKRRMGKGDFLFGGGLAIKKRIVDKYNIRFLTGKGPSPWSMGKGLMVGSIYSKLSARLHKLGLKGVELGKPCILEQDAEFANPEYEAYYRWVLDTVRKMDRSIYPKRKKISKFESIRRRGGYTQFPDEYYRGSGYEIKKHYREALNSKRGQMEWNRIRKVLGR